MSSPWLSPNFDSSSFSGGTLILPVVSVGNVGQLAADLLIASLSLRRVAILDSSALVPVAGAREDGEEGVTTPLEVFGKAGSKTFVIQQRSPAMYSMKEQFTSSITAFVKDNKFASLLLLCGVDVSARGDQHMSSPIYSYVLSFSTATSHNDALTSLVPPFVPNDSADEIPFIPGGGLTRRILFALKSAQSTTLSIGVLLQFVMEGDNRADAKLLAEVAAKVTSLPITIWKQPPSWTYGLFGTPQEQTLYG